MHSSVNLQEVAIVIVAQHHNPAMLNLEFLKCSGIVPADWELARPPIVNSQTAQLLFQNGISLTAQGNQILFVESIATKSPQEVSVADLARQYIELLPHAQYQAAGINLRGFVPFADSADAATQYLMQQLLAPGPWQQYGEATARASINFVYPLANRRLFLSINEAALQLPEGQSSPIVLFSGNFEYAIENDVAKLGECLNNWQRDLEVYNDLVNTRFLGSKPSDWSLPMNEPELLPMSA